MPEGVIIENQEQKKEPISISDMTEIVSGVPKFKGKELVFSIQGQEEVNSPDLAPYVRQILEIIGSPEAWVTDETMICDFIYLLLFTKKELEKYQQEIIEKLSQGLGFQVKEEDFLFEVAKKLKIKEENQRE